MKPRTRVDTGVGLVAVTALVVCGCAVAADGGIETPPPSDDETTTVQGAIQQVVWTQIPGKAYDISVSRKAIWVVGTDVYNGEHRIHRGGPSWTAANIGGKRIAAEYQSGTAWVVKSNGEI